MSNTVTAYRYKSYANIKEVFIPSLKLIIHKDGYIYRADHPTITKKVLETTDTYFEGCRKGLMRPNRRDLKFLLDLASSNSMKKIQVPYDTARAVSGWRKLNEDKIKDLAELLFQISKTSDIT